MTVLLAILMVGALGTWIPLAQLLPGTSERSRLFYVAVGNVVFAGIALVASGVSLTFDWRSFWLPLAGGVVWTAGNYCVFRATASIGLARAAGTWTPLNIIVAFAWGALLFGELHGFSGVRFTILGVAFLGVVAGVLLIARSQAVPSALPGTSPPRPAATTQLGLSGDTARTGLLFAVAAGILWGSYFVPAQWAAVPSQVSNFPLALGILVSAVALRLSAREPVKPSVRAMSTQLGAGVLFGIGNLALLALVAQVGTGTGFTIAQLSLAVNASIGIWLFHIPEPGTPQARKVLAGIVIAGIASGVIAAI